MIKLYRTWIHLSLTCFEFIPYLSTTLLVVFINYSRKFSRFNFFFKFKEEQIASKILSQFLFFFQLTNSKTGFYNLPELQFKNYRTLIKRIWQKSKTLYPVQTWIRRKYRNTTNCKHSWFLRNQGSNSVAILSTSSHSHKLVCPKSPPIISRSRTLITVCEFISDFAISRASRTKFIFYKVITLFSSFFEILVYKLESYKEVEIEPKS